LKHKLLSSIKIKIDIVLWFILSLLGSPLLIPIALRIKKLTPRLPEAEGNPFGLVNFSNSEITKRIVFLGESPVAGVGVKHYERSLTACTASSLSLALGCNIDWRAVGENGIDIKQTVARLLGKALESPIDYLVVVLGVNDVTKMRSFKNWHVQIEILIKQVRKQSNCQIIFYGCPPLGKFPALPKLLSLVAGYRASILDNISRTHPLNNKEFQFVVFESAVSKQLFATDGYHPSEKGCVEMGRKISADIMTLFTNAHAVN